MVFAFAGDSTITRFFAIGCGVHFNYCSKVKAKNRQLSSPLIKELFSGLRYYYVIDFLKSDKLSALLVSLYHRERK